MENGIFIGRSAERNLPDTLLNPVTEKEMLTFEKIFLTFLKKRHIRIYRCIWHFLARHRIDSLIKG
jgi:hypothetical protein